MKWKRYENVYKWRAARHVRETPLADAYSGRTRLPLLSHPVCPLRRREENAAYTASALIQHIRRRCCEGHGCGGGRGDIPQLHAAARRHHGQRRRAPRARVGICEVGRQCGAPVGRCDAYIGICTVEACAGGAAAPHHGHLQHHGGAGVRGTAVRHGFRDAPEGFGRRVHAHDRAFTSSASSSGLRSSFRTTCSTATETSAWARR